MRPEVRAAKAYMEDKGYPNVDPSEVRKVEGRDCWYVTFPITGGSVELQVEFDDSGWSWSVASVWENRP